MTATAALTPPSTTTIVDDNVNSAMARKRRREIILSQRASTPSSPPENISLGGNVSAAVGCKVTSGRPACAPTPVVPEQETPSVSDDEAEPGKLGMLVSASAKLDSSVGDDNEVSSETKKRRKNKTTTSQTSSNSDEVAKKPQMRYDPDVPMSKDEAAAWRREQRRKRNRESAAASRQKQRDRISELEVEVEEWKTKFTEAMERLQKLEAMIHGTGSMDAPQASPLETGSCETPVQHEDDENYHLYEKISRQA